MKLYISFDLPQDQLDTVHELIQLRRIPFPYQAHYCFPVKEGWAILKYDSGYSTGELYCATLENEKIHKITFTNIAVYGIQQSILELIYQLSKTETPTGICIRCNVYDFLDNKTCLHCRGEIVSPTMTPYQKLAYLQSKGRS